MSTLISTSTDIRARPNNPRKARKPQQRSMPLRLAIEYIAGQYETLTVRQLFYRLVSMRVIEKTEQAYKRVSDASGQMRLDGSLPYRKIVDGHRTRRITFAHDSLQDALKDAHGLYRRDYWSRQPAHLEVWCEKDALSGVIYPLCDAYGVPYVATRGFPSSTLIYESAQAMIRAGKPSVVFYFGDHDASGRCISDNLERDLRSHGADVTVKRVALEPWQIEAYSLPTRPGKSQDSRHREFIQEYGNRCVELDALPPDMLAEMIGGCIESVIEWEEWGRMQSIENAERETLASIAALPIQAGVIYDLAEGGTT